MKPTIRIWKNDTLRISPRNTGEKRKDQENIIMITITITNITMTMTMTEIVGPETGINHTIEIGHIVETDCKTTIKMITKMITKMTTEITIKMIIGMITEMTTEMTIEMTTEMIVEKEIIGISKTRNIRGNIDRYNYKNTYEDRYIDYCSTTYKDSHGDKYRDKYRDDSYDQIRGRSKEKDYLYYDDDTFDSEIRRVHKILQTMSQEKEMAI